MDPLAAWGVIFASMLASAYNRSRSAWPCSLCHWSPPPLFGRHRSPSLDIARHRSTSLDIARHRSAIARHRSAIARHRSAIGLPSVYRDGPMDQPDPSDPLPPPVSTFLDSIGLSRWTDGSDGTSGSNANDRRKNTPLTGKLHENRAEMGVYVVFYTLDEVEILAQESATQPTTSNE